MTKKKHEELVNEMAGELNTLFCAGRDGGIPRKLPQVMAESFIALILSAVRDGLELPGEAGRLEEKATARCLVSGCDDCREVSKGLRQWIINQFNGGARKFIALRPLTGTGKEEEAAHPILRYCERCGSVEHYTSEHC